VMAHETYRFRVRATTSSTDFYGPFCDWLTVTPTAWVGVPGSPQSLANNAAITASGKVGLTW